MNKSIKLTDKKIIELEKAEEKKDLLINKLKNFKDELENYDKIEKHIKKIGGLIKKPDIKKKDELKKQKEQLENLIKNVNRNDLSKSISNLKKELEEVKDKSKNIIEELKSYKNELAAEKKKTDKEIKEYDKLKNHEKKLTQKINHYESQKKKINIIDTDHDGVNDLVEVRGDDGQLRTNPDKSDLKKSELDELIKKDNKLTKDIKKLKKQRNKVRAKIAKIKIKNLRENSKALGAKSLAIGKAISRGCLLYTSPSPRD